MVIHLITDRRQLAPDARTVASEMRALDAFLDDAIAAGVDVVQIREGGVDGRPLTGVVARAVRRAAGTACRVLVNDRLDVARAAGAAGVHLKSDGPSPSRVRRLEPSAIIGCSIHGDGRADQADYVMFGTVYRSTSKPDASPVAGLDGLRRAVTHSTRPVIAVGGILPARVAEVFATGAAGVAAIGLFLPPGRAAGAMGVRAAIAALRDAIAGAPSSYRSGSATC